MNAAARLSIAGFAATGIAFGPARMGYGLFLPEFRATFGFSTITAGAISSAGFLAFLCALPFAALLVLRSGPRLPVFLGGLTALAGFVILATAGDVEAISIGVIVAGTSAGLCWTPFDDAAERIVREEEKRGNVLSVVATGTAVGAVLAGVLSLFVTRDLMTWQQAWWIFAFAALLSAVAAVFGLPGSGNSYSSGRLSLSHYFTRKAIPLYSIAFTFGATNAVFISFAADRVAEKGGLAGLSPSGASAIVFISYGAVGFVGLLTKRVEVRIGHSALLRAIFAAAGVSMLLLAAAPTSWPAVIAASGMHGAALMAVSAVISIWSIKLFPRQSTQGFTATLIALAIGAVAGPFCAGLVSRTVGNTAMFLIAALPVLIVCFCPKPYLSPPQTT